MNMDVVINFMSYILYMYVMYIYVYSIHIYYKYIYTLMYSVSWKTFTRIKNFNRCYINMNWSGYGKTIFPTISSLEQRSVLILHWVKSVNQHQNLTTSMNHWFPIFLRLSIFCLDLLKCSCVFYYLPSPISNYLNTFILATTWW